MAMVLSGCPGHLFAIETLSVCIYESTRPRCIPDSVFVDPTGGDNAS